MRTYRITHESLKKFLLTPYTPDVFIHTWDEIEAKTKSWHKDHMHVEPLDVNEVTKIYEPKEIVVEHQPEVDDSRVTPNNNISYIGQKFMLESLQKADSLRRESNIEYDLVVKIRPDIKLLAPLSLPEPNSGIVTVACNKKGNKHTACDIINIATPEDMSHITTVYDNFDEFYVHRFNRGEMKHSGFVDWLMFLGLEINWIPYYYKKQWNIVRSQK